MQITLTALHPAGFPVMITLADEEKEQLHGILQCLMDRGYRPPATDWPRTPDGLPLCLKHQAVMTRREKQGDSWHSHRVTTVQDQELWCRGFAHGDKETDGYWYEQGDPHALTTR